MKVTPLTKSPSEAKTHSILDRSLSRYGFKVAPSVRLQDVLQLEPNDRLDRYDETYFYRTAHFDFVICRETNYKTLEPEFAVEFDGQQHQTDPKQRWRDELKNRFCRSTGPFGFRLLRITAEQLYEYERVSVLAWMLERFAAWRREADGIWSDCRRRLDEIPSDDPQKREMLDSGLLDPAYDPGFLFDLEHPYPALLTISKRLQKKGVFTTEITGDEPAQLRRYIRLTRPSTVYRVGYMGCGMLRNTADPYHWNFFCNARLSESPVTPEDMSPGGRLLLSVKKEVSLKWSSSTGPEFKPIHHDLPGASIPNIASGLLHYLCLRDIERWLSD